jgi:hypothetical protein
MSDDGVDIGKAVFDRAKALARELDLPEDSSRAQLSSALARSRMIVASQPVGFDDGDDLEHLIGHLPVEGLRAAPPLSGWRVVPARISTRKPLYHIRVRAVLCADSDGSKAAKLSEAQLTQLLKDLSNLYYHAGLMFTISAVVTVKDTMINQDFTLPAGADLKATAAPISKAEKDASCAEHNAVRNAWAKQHPGELVIFFRYGTAVNWKPKLGAWLVEAGGGFSGAHHEFVAMNQGTELVLLGHELGHYFHLPHTHGDVASLTDAEKATYPNPDEIPADREGRRQLIIAKIAEGIRAYVDDQGHPAEQGLKVLDYDGFDDTPPDPGPPIFLYQYGDSCSHDALAVDVNLKAGVRSYTVDPDRHLLMSYYFRCGGQQRFSEKQIDRMRASLEKTTFPGSNLSRHHLIAIKRPSLYTERRRIPKILPRALRSLFRRRSG